VRVEFYGTFRLITKVKAIAFEVTPACTIRDILQTVTERFPALKHELFDEHAELYADIPIYMNGRNPRLFADGLDSIIEPEDVLCLFSPISSGRINVENLNQL
jgi:MoaD family protein